MALEGGRPARNSGHSFPFQFSFKLFSGSLVVTHDRRSWRRQPDERERNPLYPKLDDSWHKRKSVQNPTSRMNSMVKIFSSSPPASAVHHWQGKNGRAPDTASNRAGASRSCGGYRGRHQNGLSANQLADRTLRQAAIATGGLMINHPEDWR